MKQHPIPVVAAFLLSRNDGKLLLHKKVEGEDEEGTPRNPELLGLWECPGGMIEGDETPEEALARELYEELHFTVRVGDLVKAVSWKGMDGQPYLVLFYLCYRDDAHKHPDCVWVDFLDLVRMSPNTFIPREYDIIVELAKEYM